MELSLTFSTRVRLENKDESSDVPNRARITFLSSLHCQNTTMLLVLLLKVRYLIMPRGKNMEYLLAVIRHVYATLQAAVTCFEIWSFHSQNWS